jgi:hypothetical protein
MQPTQVLLPCLGGFLLHSDVAKLTLPLYTYSMNSPTSVLSRFLDPFTECLTPEVAQRVADLRPDAATQARIDELREKANEGKLSEAERAEYEG